MRGKKEVIQVTLQHVNFCATECESLLVNQTKTVNSCLSGIVFWGQRKAFQSPKRKQSESKDDSTYWNLHSHSSTFLFLTRDLLDFLEIVGRRGRAALSLPNQTINLISHHRVLTTTKSNMKTKQKQA